MLNYLREELIERIVPIMEKLPDVEKNRAEQLILIVETKISASNNAYEIPAWYANNHAVRDSVSYFKENENGRLSLFGDTMEWLLTKAAYFYTDD